MSEPVFCGGPLPCAFSRRAHMATVEQFDILVDCDCAGLRFFDAEEMKD